MEDNQKPGLEAIAWLEIDCCLQYISKHIPGLDNIMFDPEMVKAVNSVRTGIKPFNIKWVKTPGCFNRIRIPYFIISNPIARKQTAWLIAGFIHSARRMARLGDTKWKKISRAGGIAGLLMPRLRQSLSLSRLEPQAVLILAAAGKLSWTRLKVPGIHHFIARLHQKDIESAGWLEKTQKIAFEESRMPAPKGNAVFEMILEQELLECKRLSEHFGSDESKARDSSLKVQAARSLSLALESYLNLIRSKGVKQARTVKPSVLQSKAQEEIWSLITSKKIEGADVLNAVEIADQFIIDAMVSKS